MKHRHVGLPSRSTLLLSIGPVLFIVVAIAGLVFGEDARKRRHRGRRSGTFIQTGLLGPWGRFIVFVVLIATEMSRAVSLFRHRAVRHQCACHCAQNRRERAL